MNITGIVLYGSSFAGPEQNVPGMALRFANISLEDQKFCPRFYERGTHEKHINSEEIIISAVFGMDLVDVPHSMWIL